MDAKKKGKQVYYRICNCGERFETTNKDQTLCVWCETREYDGMMNDREMGDN